MPPQTVTVTATDPYGNTDLAYTGNHTLTFTGANSSTNPATAPTFRDRLAVDQNFGAANTSLTFAVGVASGTMKLYKTEAAVISATDGTATSAGSDRLSVAVTAAAATAWSSPAAQRRPRAPARPVTVTATDPYGNTDLTYSGAKTLTYSGANSSTNPATAPTVANSVPTATNFGAATTNTFTNGVSNTAGGVGAMKLYKAETANIAVTDGTIAAGTDRLTVAVTAAAASRLVVTGSRRARPRAPARRSPVTATDP